MKKSILKTSTLAVLLLLSAFTSCNKTSNEQSKNKIAMVEGLKKSDTETKVVKTQEPVVFITGYDKGNSNFYNNARAYFKEKKYKIVEGAFSLEEIINWMNENANEEYYGDIHIVNYSNPWKGMNLETVVNGEKITEEALRKNIVQGNLPTLKNVVTKNSKIVFHSCGLGKNTELMNTLKDAFVADEAPQVVASPYYNVFGGEFSNHYLAKPYYVFYPTANSPGKVDLSKEIARKYPNEKEIDWMTALNNERERYIGEAYTTQFNVPVKWQFDYHKTDSDIPTFTMQEEVMDWIENNEDLAPELSKLKIPVDKFRWTWNVKNNVLTIKGKATVLCVLKPLTKPYGDLKHLEPDTKNKRLYAMK